MTTSGFAIGNATQMSDKIEPQEAAERFINSIPENAFGGMYYDKDGNLIVNVTEGYEIEQNAISVHGIGSLFLVRKVKYSQAELEAMKELISPYMLTCNIAILYTSEEENTVEVVLYEENELFYKLLQNLSGIDTEVVNVTICNGEYSDLIAEEPPDQIPEEFQAMYNSVSLLSMNVSTTTIFPGMVLRFDNETTMLGTAGPRKDSYSFYSAAHCSDSDSYPDVYLRDMPATGPFKNNIGIVTDRYYANDGDWCTIAVQNMGALPPENMLFGSAGRYTITDNCESGAEVEAWCGFSGILTGSIIDADAIVSTGTVVLYDMILTDIVSQSGDSGAALFTANIFTDPNGECFGVLKGGVTYANGARFTIFSRVW